MKPKVTGSDVDSSVLRFHVITSQHDNQINSIDRTSKTKFRTIFPTDCKAIFYENRRQMHDIPLHANVSRTCTIKLLGERFITTTLLHSNISFRKCLRYRILYVMFYWHRSFNQSINKSVSQLINESMNELINQSIDQSVNRPGNKWINQ